MIFFLEEEAIKSQTKTSAKPEIVLEKEAEENYVSFNELENGNFIQKKNIDIYSHK